MPQKNWANFARHVLPAIVYSVVIFIGGSLPKGPKLGLEFRHQDKVLHALAFGILAALIWRAVVYLWVEERPMIWALISVVVASAVGGALELWQALLPARDADILDFLADALGAAIAASLLFRGYSRRPAHQVASPGQHD